MTNDASLSSWWSIPQAIVWIVTRNESQVLRADGIRMVAGLGRMTGIRPASSPEEPPVSLAAAPDVLLRAWRTRFISLFGCEWGRGQPRPVPRRNDFCIRDHRGEACIGDSSLYFGSSPFRSNLSVRADECKHCWPVLARQSARAPRLSATASSLTDDEVLVFMEERRKSLRAERKNAGRDVLLRAAMVRFGL